MKTQSRISDGKLSGLAIELVFFAPIALVMLAFSTTIASFGRDEFSMLKFFFEASTILVVCGLYFFPYRKAKALFLAGAYLCFAAYHVFNIGKPCGCLIQDQLSSSTMVVGNILISFGLACSILMFGTSIANKGALATCCIFLTWVGTGLDLSDAISGESRRQTIESIEARIGDVGISFEDSQPFANKEWQAWVFNVNCDACREKASKLVGVDRAKVVFQHAVSSKRVAFCSASSSTEFSVYSVDFVVNGTKYEGDLSPFWLSINNGNVVDSSILLLDPVP